VCRFCGSLGAHIGTFRIVIAGRDKPGHVSRAFDI
jgi:hypothetical protein